MSTPEAGDNGYGKQSALDDQVAATGELREHDTLVQARDAVKNLYQQLDIEGRVRRNPLGMVAAALGLGFVLGGGLTTSLARRLLGIGVNRGIRLVLLPMLTEHLWGLAGSKRTGASTEPSPHGHGKRGLA